MKTEIAVALIGGGAAIIAAALGLLKSKKREDDPEGKSVSNRFNKTNIEGKTIVMGGKVIDNSRIIDSKKEEANLQIVDTEFIDNRGCYIDIKLRNAGDRVAYITRIEFNVHDCHRIENRLKVHHALQMPTATYDIVLNDREYQAFPLSQEIKGNRADRFRIKVACRTDISNPYMPAIYHLSYSLFYNEDQRKVTSDSFVVLIPSEHMETNADNWTIQDSVSIHSISEIIRFNNMPSKKSKAFERLYRAKLKKDDFKE